MARWIVTLLLSLLWTVHPACAAGQAYVFGVPPWQRGQAVDDIRRLYRPMLDYLTQQTGADFVLVSSKTYEEMVEYLASGKVHLGTISPAPYVLAQKSNPGVRMLLVEQSWNEDRTAKVDRYTGYIVALRSRTDIQHLGDLKRMRFGFVNRDSTSGFLYPAALLAEAGIDYRASFASHVFLGSHPRVTDAVAAGSVDAGATWNFNMHQARTKHGDIFKTIAEVRIPNLGIATHPSLPSALRDSIKRALLKISPDLLTGLPTAGYVERPDSDYDVVRRLVATKQP